MIKSSVNYVEALEWVAPNEILLLAVKRLLCAEACKALQWQFRIFLDTICKSMTHKSNRHCYGNTYILKEHILWLSFCWNSSGSIGWRLEVFHSRFIMIYFFHFQQLNLLFLLCNVKSSNVRTYYNILFFLFLLHVETFLFL